MSDRRCNKGGVVLRKTVKTIVFEVSVNGTGSDGIQLERSQHTVISSVSVSSANGSGTAVYNGL